MLEHKLEKQKSGSKSTNKNNISNVDNNMVEPANTILNSSNRSQHKTEYT